MSRFRNFYHNFYFTQYLWAQFVNSGRGGMKQLNQGTCTSGVSLLLSVRKKWENITLSSKKPRKWFSFSKTREAVKPSPHLKHNSELQKKNRESFLGEDVSNGSRKHISDKIGEQWWSNLNRGIYEWYYLIIYQQIKLIKYSDALFEDPSVLKNEEMIKSYINDGIF